MIKALVALILVLGLTACGESASTDSATSTEKTAVDSQANANTETGENKENLNNVGNIEIRITEKYSPQTLELESVSLDYSVRSCRIETQNLLIPSVLTLGANDKSQQKIYLSQENTNALRNMSIQIYDELIKITKMRLIRYIKKCALDLQMVIQIICLATQTLNSALI